MTWHNVMWRGVTWRDVTWHEMTLHDMTWYDMTWHGITWHDVTWRDVTWHDMVSSSYVIKYNLSTLILFQECTQPLTLYRSLKLWNMVPIGVKWFLTRTGPCATAHKEVGGFIYSKKGVPHPNIQFHFVPLGYKDDGRVILQRDAFKVRRRFALKAFL